MIERLFGFAFGVLGRIRRGEAGDALRHVGAELDRLAERRASTVAARRASPSTPIDAK